MDFTNFSGILQDWWAPETNQKFKERAQCIINQYGNFSAKQVNLNLNGINTQGENIADNGGVKEAYLGTYSDPNLNNHFFKKKLMNFRIHKMG